MKGKKGQGSVYHVIFAARNQYTCNIVVVIRYIYVITMLTKYVSTYYITRNHNSKLHCNSNFWYDSQHIVASKSDSLFCVFITPHGTLSVIGPMLEPSVSVPFVGGQSRCWQGALPLPHTWKCTWMTMRQNTIPSKIRI